MTSARPKPSALAWVLGAGGLLPFVGLAAALAVAPIAWRAAAATALLGDGAVSVGFLGGIHWGLGMAGDTGNVTPSALFWGVVPSLLGWLALLAGPLPGLLIVAGSLWLCLAVDAASDARRGLRTWMPLRLALTVGASSACLAAAFVVARGGAPS